MSAWRYAARCPAAARCAALSAQLAAGLSPQPIIAGRKRASWRRLTARCPRYSTSPRPRSGDATARIWDLSGSGDARARVLDHPPGDDSAKGKDVTTLEWSPDGSLLATGAYDGRARVWTKEGEALGAAARGPADHCAAAMTAAPDSVQLSTAPVRLLVLPTAPPPLISLLLSAPPCLFSAQASSRRRSRATRAPSLRCAGTGAATCCSPAAPTRAPWCGTSRRARCGSSSPSREVRPTAAMRCSAGCCWQLLCVWQACCWVFVAPLRLLPLQTLLTPGATHAGAARPKISAPLPPCSPQPSSMPTGATRSRLRPAPRTTTSTCASWAATSRSRPGRGTPTRCACGAATVSAATVP